MTISQCIDQLLEVETIRNEKGKLHLFISLSLYLAFPLFSFELVYSESSICIGLARVGRDDSIVVSGTMNQLRKHDFGGPLHSFVIPGNMHELEQEYVESLKIQLQ
jgi:diphthine synthase